MRPLTTPVGVLTLALFACGLLRGQEMKSVPGALSGYDPAKDTLVYVGTYTGAKSKGIYAFRLQTQNEEVSQNILLVPLGLVAESANPSFLAVDEKRRLLFAVNEIDSFGGKASGAVSAFAIDSATGKLALINQQPSLGTGPCHLVLDKTGKNLLVANYNRGSVAVTAVAGDGLLGDAAAGVVRDDKFFVGLIQHEVT